VVVAGDSAVVVVAAAVADAVVAAAEGDNHVNIDSNHNETDEGGRNDTSGNTS
jgi:hypothetical protein